MTDPTAPRSRAEEDAIRAVVAAWATRPADEGISSVEEETEAAPIGHGTAREATLDAIREIAAVSGAVRPGDLLPHGASVLGVLASAAADFDRSLVGGQTMWTLRTGARSAVLARLVEHAGALSAALERASTVTTDEAGRLLRRLLRDGIPRLPDQSASPEAAAALLQALQWAIPAGTDPDQLARAAARARGVAILDGYRGLLDHGVVGRGAEIRRIEKFIDDPWRRGPGRIRTLTVEGIGGAGKSTLLAAVLEPRLGRLVAGEPGPALVVIDLDRIALRPDAEAELSLEVVRQLELAWPELAADLADIRAATARDRRGRRELTSGSSIEASLKGSASAELRLGDLLGHSVRSREPIILVFDTFEEWQRSRPKTGMRAGEAPDLILAEWLERFVSAARVTDLRVIVSGRGGFQTPGSAAHVKLDDLRPSDARELLLAAGAHSDSIARLVEIVGGNPLTLRVAARFDRSLDADARTRFLASSGADPGLDAEVRRAVLYDRFLDHIADPDVRRLAHPGLALRRVTPELIRDVLAEECGLAPMTEETARLLFDRLADEVWLVRRSGDGSLHHLPELRRGMVAMMARDPELGATARAVHRRAAAWYNPVPGVDDPVSEENVEAFYHRMMATDGTPSVYPGPWAPSTRTGEPRRGSVTATRRGHEASRAQIARLARALGDGVAELPPAVQAQLRLARGELLTDAEAQLLPPELRVEYVETVGRSLVEHDDPDAAVRLVLSRPWPDVPQPGWLAQAFCDGGRWDDYAKIVLARSREGARPGDRLWSDGAVWRGPRSRHAFVNLILGEDPRLERTAFRGLRPLGPGEDGDPSPAFFRALGRAAAGEEQVADRVGVRPRYPRRALYPIDQLRFLVLAMLEGGASATFDDLAGLLAPDPEVMAAFAQLTGSPVFEVVVDQLKELALAHVRSTDILGGLAASISSRPVSVSVQPESAHLVLGTLRGDNPELRPAIRHVLRRVAPDDGWLKELGAIAQSVVAIPVEDLEPDALPLMRDVGARSALVTLVEYVDRSRVTPAFLREAHHAHPGSPDLDRLVRAVERWDVAHRVLLAEAARRLDVRFSA